ncbi:MAG TPA: hypothetical protein VGF94_00835 [Kofleriaceae bacterium]|jgi:hypothetical protein
MRHLTSLILLGSSLVAFGCAKQGDSSTDSASDAVDSSDSVESEGNVMMAFTDGADGNSLTALDAATVAATINGNIALRWQCKGGGTATSTVTGATITVTLDDCTGPRGLVHVTGEIDLAVSVDATGVITVHGTATDLQVNAATLSFDSTGVYGVMGTTHTLAVQTQGQGTGPRGTEIDHDGNYTLSWDTASQCGSIDGQWSTEFSTGVASATRSNDANISRCTGGCPTGSLVHDFLGGKSLTITFDGSNVAAWMLSTGASGTVNLLCQ